MSKMNLTNNDFENLYGVTKTLRFKLIPNESTKQWLEKDKTIVLEKEFISNTEVVAALLDNYHKNYIREKLADLDMKKFVKAAANYLHTKQENGHGEYKIYFRDDAITDTDDEPRAAYYALMNDILEHVSCKLYKEEFKSTKQSLLLMKEMFYDGLSEEDKNIVDICMKHVPAFDALRTNRLLLYGIKEGSVAKRIFDNVMKVAQIRNTIATFPHEFELFFNKYELKDMYLYNGIGLFGFGVDDIAKYNSFILGYKGEDGKIVPGLNMIINHYNQVAKDKKLPILNPLYKIPMFDGSDVETKKYIETDQECIDMMFELIGETKDLFTNMDIEDLFTNVDLSKTYLKKSAISYVSSEYYGSWKHIYDKIKGYYDSTLGNQNSKPAKYDKDRNKWVYGHTEFDLLFLNDCTNTEMHTRLLKRMVVIFDKIKVACEEQHELFDIEYPKDRRLQSDSDMVTTIKAILDNYIELNRIVSLFIVPEDKDIDDKFYTQHSELLSLFNKANSYYNLIRNYCTKKIDNSGKIRCLFGNPNFGSSLDKDLVKTTGNAIIKIDTDYYFAAVPKYKVNRKSPFKTIMSELPESNMGCEMMYYKQLSDSFKTLPGILLNEKRFERLSEEYGLTEEIMELYNMYKLRKSIEWDKKEEAKIIAYYIDAIGKHSTLSTYPLIFKNPEDYDGLNEFYNHLDSQTYSLDFVPINKDLLMDYVNEGSIYLFKIYARHLNGTSAANGHKSIQSMYFREIFEGDRLNVYKLLSIAKVFWRPIKVDKRDTIIHPAGTPIPFKTKDGSRTFAYDIIKNKRYTEEHFEFHITINANPIAGKARSINSKILDMLKATDGDFNVLSIDRGEQNLIYYTVFNSISLDILEQGTLNIIDGQNYHKLLTATSTQIRENQSERWKYDNQIKNIKTGYLNLVIRKVTDLIFKYDAIVVMEKLSKEFKSSRRHIGIDVYSQFEKALITKLNLYVDKHKGVDELGGIRHPLQLTNEFVSFKKIGLQNGIIFYVDPAFTSKIDPKTGYIDRFGSLKYKNINDTKEFISKINFISRTDNCIKFGIDMSKFFEYALDHEWWTLTVMENVNDSRIEWYSDENRGGMMKSQLIDSLYDQWVKFFNKYDIEEQSDLLNKSLPKNCYSDFIRLFKLTTQIRNINIGGEGFVLSPVKLNDKEFFDSRKGYPNLPTNPDANDAYCIGIKGLSMIEKLLASNNYKMSKADFLTISASKYLHDIYSE